jgi:hypothetical protein
VDILVALDKKEESGDEIKSFILALNSSTKKLLIAPFRWSLKSMTIKLAARTITITVRITLGFVLMIICYPDQDFTHAVFGNVPHSTYCNILNPCYGTTKFWKYNQGFYGRG